jgi:uncharacterized phage protein (TIGR01671 family)
MREYKFRGKCVERDKWVYGYYVKGIQEDEAYILKNHNWLLGDDFIDVYPETVGQYTGLKDKNGIEIYEGDIVTGLFNRTNIIGYIVYGSDATFFIKRKGLYGIGLNNAEDWLEVVGNIYENLELLKE